MLVISFIAYNYYADDFGLWRQHEKRRVWTESVSSKYLMSIKYVPENYDNIIIGPSVSEILDPGRIQSAGFYNLSSAGANIQKQQPAIKAYFDSAKPGGILLVTLYPYFVNHHKPIRDSVFEKPFQSTLFSLFPIQVIVSKLQNALLKTDNVYDESHNGRGKISNWKIHVNKKLDSYLDKLSKRRSAYIESNGASEKPFTVNDDSVAQLRATIEMAKENEFEVIAYYYPLNKWDFEFRNLTGDWARFRQAMDTVFNKSDVVIDFNVDEFDYIRAEKSNYRDTHMTEQGARLLEQALDKQLLNWRDN